MANQNTNQIVPSTRYFVGFSTQNTSQTGVSAFYDIDLINNDLMTAFQTRVGERVMRPDYGCKIYNYLMEPFTSFVAQSIIDEAVRIVELDSRCVVMNIQASEANQGIRIEILLAYQPWNVIQTFFVTFQQNDLIYYGSANSNTLLAQ